MTFHAGVNSEETVPEIFCCDDNDGTQYTVELSDTQGLAEFFKYDKTNNKLKFTDNDKKAKKYIAQKGLQLGIVLGRQYNDAAKDKTYDIERTYVIDLTFDQIEAPTFEGEVFTKINFMTDQSKTVTTPPIVEGTFAPAT